MDRLESQLERGSFRPDDVDRSLAQELLGPEARQALDQLRRVTDVLEKAGYVERRGRRLELTPRGTRKIGQKALQDIFAHLKKDRFGKHELKSRRHGGDATDETKLYEFGDPFLMDIKGTLMNATRSARAQAPVRIGADDFEFTAPSTDPVVDGADARHEPLDAAARLLPGGQEGGAGAQLA